MLVALQLVAIIGIFAAAVMGKGSRVSYFGLAIAAALVGLAFLSYVSTPEELVAMSQAERVEAERLNYLAPPIAWTLFAAAFGGVIGGLVFRTPPAATGEAET